MDIEDSWQSVTDIMDHYAMKQDFWQRLAGPGHWNDPDMVFKTKYLIYILHEIINNMFYIKFKNSITVKPRSEGSCL